MAVWYEVEKTPMGIQNFLDCNWAFHDFFIEKVEYLPRQKRIKLFLRYDELKGSVILIFLGVCEFNIVPPNDDYDDYLMGTVLTLSDDNNLLWLADDSYPQEQANEIQKYATWIKSNQIIWAVTDQNGNPAEMPDNKINQIWQTYGKIEQKHFALKEYIG
jgi:hypothetical protein